MPKAYQKLIVVLFILSCFTAFSQTEKTQQQKNEEYGKALKEWFDSGDLIVELSTQETDVVFVKTNGDYGYMCAKAKITRILKGNIEKGFININTNSPQKREVEIVDEGADVSKVIGTRCIVRIKKSNLPQGFKTESTGVYVTEDKVYRLEEVGFDEHYKMVDGKKTVYNSTKAFYKFLFDYCGVNSGNK
jgi:hypothetical protein